MAFGSPLRPYSAAIVDYRLQVESGTAPFTNQ
jgi:hypothetical protein